MERALAYADEIRIYHGAKITRSLPDLPEELELAELLKEEVAPDGTET